jgi:hypothetical protein
MRIPVYAAGLLLAAAIAGVGIAGVTAAVPTVGGLIAPRGDRLVVASGPADERYVTVETRRAGTSVLTRIPVADGG